MTLLARRVSRLLVFSALFVAMGAVTAEAAKKKPRAGSVGKGKALSTQSARKVSRELIFDGTDVNGRYHSSGGAVAKVEQEKKMNSLIGLRGDFKDRLRDERERLKRQEGR